jgi:hypothetical protein
MFAGHLRHTRRLLHIESEWTIQLVGFDGDEIYRNTRY